MILKDGDDDFLEIKEVYGFGEPMLLFRVNQEGDESQVIMTVAQAETLIDHLKNWVSISTAVCKTAGSK